jgi:hypothetical protein
MTARPGAELRGADAASGAGSPFPAEPPINELLARLGDARRYGDGWRACCPAHDDHRPSLHVREADDHRVLVRCFAGCSAEAVVAALGLHMRDLFARDGRWHPPARPRPPRARPARRLKKPDGPPPVVIRVHEFEIRDEHGLLHAIHVRKDLSDGSKQMPWKRVPGGPSKIVPVELPLFGAHLLHTWPADAPIFLTEGETDAEALQAVGAPALGTVCGASSTPADESLRLLRGRRVLLWPDNDPAGREHMLRISARLRALGIEYAWIRWDASAKGDGAADFLARQRGSDHAG